MKAVILAAGRGSRMGALTQEQPKCLTVLAGQPLLFWQLSALSAASILDIAVITGYTGEKIRALATKGPAPFTTLENPHWSETNMLTTLLFAANWAAGEECLISYSDIVYPARHVRSLMASAEPIALTYDRQWEALWSLRNDGNPLEDAETFREENGILRSIGGKPHNLGQVQGQYMGLLKLSPEGWNTWLDNCRKLGAAVDKTDMTGFLNHLLRKNTRIGAVPVDGAWCEVDNGKDLQLYEKALTEENWAHDWRA